MVDVYSLIDNKEAKYLFQVKRLDGWTWVVTFVATLAIGIEQGIIIGAVFSLLIFIGRSAYPHVAELGFLQGQNIYRNIERHPEAQTEEDILIFRVDASLYFANIAFLENKLCDRVRDKSNVKWVIFDLDRKSTRLNSSHVAI